MDRDGVINANVGYVHRIDQFHCINEVFGARQADCKEDYRVILVTSQADIAHGYYTEDDFR